MKAIIKVEYPGSVISVNHYQGRRKGGGTYTKQGARDFMEEIGWMIKHLHIEDWKLPLQVYCSGYFKDERSAPDLSNLSKCVLDAIQEVTGYNDKNFRWHDGKREIGFKEPYLLITIIGAGYSPDRLADAL